jgi:hypothetical protein
MLFGKLDDVVDFLTDCGVGEVILVGRVQKCQQLP